MYSMVYGLIAIFAVIIILQVPPLVKKDLWKELIVYGVILSLGIIYSIGQLYHWPLPNPTKKAEYLFAPISKFLEKVMS